MTAHWLALGDSYTICTGASAASARWPEIVAQRLARTDGAVEVTNLGVNGWTTQQVIERQAPRLAERAWDIVSVLAGVNDEYRGVGVDVYCGRIERLHELVSAAAPRHVVALSIPDYSYTPVGRAAKPVDVTVARLRAFNDVAQASAARHGFVWVDLFELSRSRIDDAGWVAGDGLHPSDAQYAAWADHVLQATRELV